MLRTFALLLLASVLAGPASAQLVIYRGAPDCNTNAGQGSILIGGGPTPFLVCFDDPGGGTPVQGQECSGGTADEVCGVDVELRTTGAVVIDSFVAVGDWVFGLTPTVNPTLLKANGGNPLTGNATPTAIGTITVTATGPGTLEVTGKNWVDSTLSLQTIAPIVLAQTSGTADFDGDGLGDALDSCPTIANAGSDTDMDNVDSACDTCLNQANAPVSGTSVPTNRTLVSRQYDDDADGRGNACDFDYNNAGVSLDSTDFNQIKASIGKLMTANNCGLTPTNNQRCGEFDHTGGGAVVDNNDFNLAKAAVLAGGLINTNFPKCAACTTPFSRPIGAGGGSPLAGKPVCETAVSGACPY
jgi:hypothetical protein